MHDSRMDVLMSYLSMRMREIREEEARRNVVYAKDMRLIPYDENGNLCWDRAWYPRSTIDYPYSWLGRGG